MFSNAVLHWITEPELVVAVSGKSAGARRPLRRGIWWQRKCQPRHRRRQQSVHEVWNRARARGEHLVLPERGRLSRRSLQKEGLEVRDAKLFDRPTRLEDGEKGLEAWISMFLKFALDRFPPERQQEFLREIERQARPELFRGGNRELDYRRLRIAAWKQV